MTPATRQKFVRFAPAIPGILTVFLVLFFQIIDLTPLRQASLLLFDSYQRLEPRAYMESPVRVIDIDDASIERVGQWPWPRDQIAALNDRLTDAGASAIAYDIVFSEADRTSPDHVIRRLSRTQKAKFPAGEKLPNNDAIFAQSLSESPSVLGYFLDPNQKDERDIIKAGVNLSGTVPEGVVANFPGALAAIDPLLEAAQGNGFITIESDLDGIVRTAPMVASLNEQIIASLSSEALRVAQGAGSMTLKSTDGSGETDAADPQITALKLGAFTAPLTRDGHLYLYYREPIEDQTIAAWKILEGSLSVEEQSSLIEGQIILIGAGAQGLRDLKSTPLAASELGVNIHAQALEQIINQQFLIKPDWATGLERIILVLLGLTLAFLLPSFGALKGGILAAAALILVTGGSYYAFSSHQLLLNPVYPFLAVILAYLAVTMLTYYREENQRAFIHNAFDRYLSPDLVKQIAADPKQLQLGGEERDMTVLFCDIRNFSRISEQLSPQDIITFLIKFLTPMTDILLRRKATIDKYIGDAILAFWNAPLYDDDQYRNAARGALEMIERLKSLNREMQNQSKDPWPGEVHIGIGMNCGPCCVGNMGSSQRLSYSLIGDTVNVASRLEGLTKQYGVSLAIGDSLARNLDGFAVLEIDKVKVVGRETAELIHVLLGDENMAADLDFLGYAQQHQIMLGHYRAKQWKAATKILAEMEEMAEKYGLGSLNQIYRQRIETFDKTPPPEDWNGIYVASEK